MSIDMAFWLVKTEEDLYPISKLKADKVTQWTDVRNYEARNFLMAMKKNEQVLIYHSNADPSGVMGVGVVSKEAYPDPTQFNPKSDYFDPKATLEKPRWFAPDIKFKSQFENKVSLADLRAEPALNKMALFTRSRLSVQPVTEKEFEIIVNLQS
jgi:predicted RNA-binding protein with PUA-like domain